jgi:cellulose synthase/poly-beta-1,6-N-acetylglucosamine synthase-like glycosyltransferase
MNEKIVFSIVLPARNEEKVLIRALESIDRITTDKREIELLLGNDGSEDDTLEIMKVFAKNKSWVKVLDFDKDSDSETLKGKTRILNFLIEKSSGKYIVFTDADMQVPTTWIEAYKLEIKKSENVGVWVGTSGFGSRSFFDVLQEIEWLNALGFMHILSYLNISTTGMGNNMMVSKDAYNACGGYKNIGFSIIEDYALYKAIIKAGFGFKHIYSQKIMSLTLPPENFFDQRLRWLMGGLKSDSRFKIAAVILTNLVPLIIAAYFFSRPLFFTILVSVVFFHLGLFLYSLTKIPKYYNLLYFPFYLLYSGLIWPFVFLKYLFSKKIKWKNREY